MPKLFDLINKEFFAGEWRLTYELKIIFNYQPIIKVTITDHYKAEHGDIINNELILKITKTELNEEVLEPTKYQGKRKVFKWEGYHQDKRYRLIFWFEDNNSDWLWIKNCYPINPIKSKSN
jgi:hypothetical protein